MPFLYIGPLRALLTTRIFVARAVVDAIYFQPAKGQRAYQYNIDSITINPVMDGTSAHST